MEPILSARDVSFAYDNYEEKQLPPIVLEGVSLDVRPGGICGGSGPQRIR